MRFCKVGAHAFLKYKLISSSSHPSNRSMHASSHHIPTISQDVLCHPTPSSPAAMGDYVLGSVTAYRDWRIEQIGMDADFSGANILGINESLNTQVFSQEFTLSGEFQDFGPFRYADFVVGVYYTLLLLPNFCHTKPEAGAWLLSRRLSESF